MSAKSKDKETNDFDLIPEKKPALSTIKRQVKNLHGILVDACKSTIITTPPFDRLKMWIDLEKYGEKINFKKGANLGKSENPSLPPFKQYQKAMEIKKNTSIGYDYDAEDYYLEEYDEEVTDTAKQKIIYSDSSIRYELYKQTVGILNVYIKNDKLVIDVSGKFMAEYGIIGLININNIKDCLKKLQNLSLFSFDIDEFLKYAGCYIADVTLDLLFPHKAQVSRMLTAMSSFSPIISDKAICRKYKRHGLLIKNKSEQTGHSCLAYAKGEDINNSIKSNNKSVKYTEIIGFAGVEICRKTLRLECHIYKMADLRKLLNIPAKEKGFVPLMAVLKSKEPVLLNMLKEMGIDKTKLYESLTWFILHDNFFREDKFTTVKEFEEIVIAEWLARLVIDNNYQLDKVKSHIGIEYGFDLNDDYFQILMPKLKESLHRYICYRKPRSVSSILLLLERLNDEYYDADWQVLKNELLNAT